jgi:tetratricopeptide (TPR) repeat protein
LARQPDDVWARVYRAHLQAESSGNIDQAIVEWQKVKEASPLNPAAYFFLGEGYLKKGNLKESLTNVSKAIALRATGN